MSPARFRWGLLFVVAGVLIILHNACRLYWDFWWDLAQWWPLLLIAIGLEKLFSGLKLKPLAFLPPILLAAGIIYLTVNNGHYLSDSRPYTSTNWEEKLDPEVESLDVYISHGNNDLKVRKTSNYLANAGFDRSARRPKIDFERDGNIGRLTVKGSYRFGGRFINISNYRDNDWDFGFNDKVPLKLECVGDDANIRLDLSDIMLQNLSVDDDDGSIDITVGNKMPNVNLSIDGDDSRLYLTVPEQAGLEISGGDYSGYFEALGLKEVDNKFISDGFDTLAVKVHIDLETGLKHLSIQQK